MHFDLSEDQREIQRTARDLLESRSPWTAVRRAAESGTYDTELWAELAELGWPGIAVGEEYGGGGLGTVELAILLEEAGYALAATPLLSTTIAALVLEGAGSDAQRVRWLPGLASGKIRAALGWGPRDAPALVPDGEGADLVILVDAEGRARLLSAAAAEARPLETLDPTRRYAIVSGNGDPLPGDGEQTLWPALVAVAAETVGLCRRALDMTVAYAKERRQFGVPIGSFQAVSHKCADMLLATEGARGATYGAAWAASADPARTADPARVAKVATADAGKEVTAAAIQVHGGVGFTWEADLHWLYKRAQMNATFLGGASHHRARLADSMAVSAAGRSAAAPIGSPRNPSRVGAA